MAVRLIRGLDPDRIRANLERVDAEIAAAGRRRQDVQVLAAVKYVPLEELGALAEAGVRLVGENRAQDLVAKAQAHPELTWDFIGNLQSRKVKQVVAHARLIHSVATESALAQLARHANPRTRILVEVNVSGEPGKGGVAPDQLDAFIARAPVPVAGLMTMPPQAADPEDSRPYFARLRELAAERGLAELSMGTTQDYPAALREGATIIRLGTMLYASYSEQGNRP
jgi:pyridoxal phosphate enzyme (YggS family)